MTVTAASFRTSFPEFKSTTVYTDASITFWIGLAYQLLGPQWSTLLDYGVQLFVAHNLTLQFASNKAGASGQSPGQIQGPQTAGSVDKVSYSRNPGLVMNPKNGHWNLSTYGLRYIQLVKMVGAGPVHVGAAADTSGGAWAGPLGFPNAGG